jgi:archaemetzincin
MMNVTVLPVVSIRRADITSRINPYTGNKQILTADILRMLRQDLPADAFCILAVTMEDLYPDPAWNFVFGQASLRHRVGVFSFARYDSAFYGEPRDKDYMKILLHRSCKVLIHETAHMFSLTHCIYFRCVMNGSNHLQESDSRPLFLCPVCLRKLQSGIGFDVVVRYRRLLEFFRKAQFKNESDWVSTRMKWITRKNY